jgi:hypothetical protein
MESGKGFMNYRYQITRDFADRALGMAFIRKDGYCV